MNQTRMIQKMKSWKEDGKLMPVLFLGHGSPMNGIEQNIFSGQWQKLGTEIAKPRAVLVISAHWLSRGSRVTAMDLPRTIHDFGGFPAELFAVQYPAPGSPELARETQALVGADRLELDHDWGLDHGTWTIIRHMYPEAEVPVLQLSIDVRLSPREHYELGRELYELRKRGVLIIGSGNMVHNLRMIAWEKINEPDYGYDWAREINEQFKSFLLGGDHDRLIHFDQLGTAAKLAIPSTEHYLPLLYTIGLQGRSEDVRIFNDHAVGGSLTMTSVRIG